MGIEILVTPTQLVVGSNNPIKIPQGVQLSSGEYTQKELDDLYKADAQRLAVERNIIPYEKPSAIHVRYKKGYHFFKASDEANDEALRMQLEGKEPDKELYYGFIPASDIEIPYAHFVRLVLPNNSQEERISFFEEVRRSIMHNEIRVMPYPLGTGLLVTNVQKRTSTRIMLEGIELRMTNEHTLVVRYDKPHP